MKFVFLVALAVLVGACSLSDNNTAVTVTPESVHAYADYCSRQPARVTPVGYVAAGFDDVDEQCQTFFDGIVLLQKNARYASSSIATGNSQAAVIMGLVKASAGSIAVVAAGSELARKLVEGYAAEYAFSPYALETRKLAFDAMTAYRNDTGTISAINALDRSSGDNYCLAQNIVRNYAKICSISGVEALAKQAIAAGSVKKSGSDAGHGSGTANPPAPASRKLRTRTIYSPLGAGLPNYTAGNR